jgi:hypothetical protein
MVAQHPTVARAADGEGARIDGRQDVVLLASNAVTFAAAQQNFDLTDFEAGDLELDLRRQFPDLGDLDCQRAAVPGGILGEAIERQPKRSQLGLRQVTHDDRRHL